MITLSYRTLMAFAAGLAVALIGMFALQAWRADASPGDIDATFVGITPCRLIDTRTNPDFHVGPHTTLGVGDTETIAARGTNGKCKIPSDAVGLSMNVTADGATAPTFLTIWPDGKLPTAASLNPWPGEPPTPNAVTTPLSGAGSFEVYNLAGSVDVIIDVNGYYTKASLQQLNTRIAALEALTASMSKEIIDGQPTVRFTGVNVQIVDGTGDTHGTVNARGNLVVGYNENLSEARTGSHNLVVGPYHAYTSFGGFVAGFNNTAGGEHSSVAGGNNNTASGNLASVSGGDNNTASDLASSVSGGQGNTASGNYSSVSGGLFNTASGKTSSVSGGLRNTAVGNYESVAGGDDVSCSSFFEDNFVCGEGSLTPID